jgi:hypothetical protein
MSNRLGPGAGGASSDLSGPFEPGGGAPSGDTGEFSGFRPNNIYCRQERREQDRIELEPGEWANCAAKVAATTLTLARSQFAFRLVYRKCLPDAVGRAGENIHGSSSGEVVPTNCPVPFAKMVQPWPWEFDVPMSTRTESVISNPEVGENPTA